VYRIMHAATVNEISAISKNLYIICINLPAKLLLIMSNIRRNIIQHLIGDLQPKNIQAAIFDINGRTSFDLRFIYDISGYANQMKLIKPN
jgi:hypothetical protein